MNTTAIISIISICVTLFLGMIGFIVNTLIQRKNNSIQVITKKRLERRDKIQQLSSNILTLSDIDVLSFQNGDNTKDYIMELVSKCTDLRSILECEFEKDCELIQKAFKIKTQVVSFLQTNGQNEQELKKARNEFSEVIDKYITTEWQRIKLETIGKTKKHKSGYYTWHSLYIKNEETFNKNRENHDNIFLS